MVQMWGEKTVSQLASGWEFIFSNRSFGSFLTELEKYYCSRLHFAFNSSLGYAVLFKNYQVALN